MKQFHDNDDNKENSNKGNSAINKNNKVKRKLFSYENIKKAQNQETITSRLSKLEDLYKQTKQIYRQYEISLFTITKEA